MMLKETVLSYFVLNRFKEAPKQTSLHKKWIFLLSISSVNVTKSAQFPAEISSHILKKFLMENVIFCAVGLIRKYLNI